MFDNQTFDKIMYQHALEVAEIFKRKTADARMQLNDCIHEVEEQKHRAKTPPASSDIDQRVERALQVVHILSHHTEVCLTKLGFQSEN